MKLKFGLILFLALLVGVFAYSQSAPQYHNPQGPAGTLLVSDGNGRFGLNSASPGILSSGTVALSSGAATVNLTAFNYVSTPSCQATDTTAANAVKAAPASATSLALTGTTTDTIAWLCIGH